MNKILNNKLIKQILRFGVVGCIAFIIDYSLLFILREYLRMDILLSAGISFSVSVIFNYILSVKWVFKADKKQDLKEFIIFILLSIGGLIINELIMHVMVNSLDIYYMISKLFTTAIVMVYNFITRKVFIEGVKNE